MFPLIYSAVLLVASVIISEINTRFYRQSFYSFSLNLQMQAATSFWSTGFILLFLKHLGNIGPPALRVSESFVKSEWKLDGRICSNNSQNYSLPNEWFEETHEILWANFSLFPFIAQCLLLLSASFALLNYLFFCDCGRSIENFIHLASSTILPTDNKEKSKCRIARLMLLMAPHIDMYFYIDFYGVYLCFIAVLPMVLGPQAIAFVDHRLAVRLNGTDWTVVCGRKVTSQDVYSLIRCQNSYSDLTDGSICIVPNDSIVFYLCTGMYCFFFLLVACNTVSLLCRICRNIYYGWYRMNDVNLIKLLKQNVDYKQHNEVIDEFERRLFDKTSELLRKQAVDYFRRKIMYHMIKLEEMKETARKEKERSKIMKIEERARKEERSMIMKIEKRRNRIVKMEERIRKDEETSGIMKIEERARKEKEIIKIMKIEDGARKEARSMILKIEERARSRIGKIEESIRKNEERISIKKLDERARKEDRNRESFKKIEEKERERKKNDEE